MVNAEIIACLSTPLSDSYLNVVTKEETVTFSLTASISEGSILTAENSLTLSVTLSDTQSNTLTTYGLITLSEVLADSYTGAFLFSESLAFPITLSQTEVGEISGNTYEESLTFSIAFSDAEGVVLTAVGDITLPITETLNAVFAPGILESSLILSLTESLTLVGGLDSPVKVIKFTAESISFPTVSGESFKTPTLDTEKLQIPTYNSESLVK